MAVGERGTENREQGTEGTPRHGGQAVTEVPINQFKSIPKLGISLGFYRLHSGLNRIITEFHSSRSQAYSNMIRLKCG